MVINMKKNQKQLFILIYKKYRQNYIVLLFNIVLKNN